MAILLYRGTRLARESAREIQFELKASCVSFARMLRGRLHERGMNTRLIITNYCPRGLAAWPVFSCTDVCVCGCSEKLRRASRQRGQHTWPKHAEVITFRRSPGCVLASYHEQTYTSTITECPQWEVFRTELLEQKPGGFGNRAERQGAITVLGATIWCR